MALALGSGGRGGGRPAASRAGLYHDARSGRLLACIFADKPVPLHLAAMSSGQLTSSSSKHIVLVLPFTASTYLHPAPLLRIIHSHFLANPAASYTVLFSTPEQPRRRSSAFSSSYQDVAPLPQGPSEQLYVQLKRNPRANFAGMQTFLGAVYAALSGAVWASGRILTDVDVRFEGEAGVEAGLVDMLSSQGTVVFGLEGERCWSSAQKVVAHGPGSESVPVSEKLRGSIRNRRDLPLETSISTLTAFAPPPPSAGPAVVALGGTFDHLHAAHKLLIQLGAFLATRKLIVGVMSDRLLKTKNHPELLEPLPQRKDHVEAFLTRCGATKAQTDGNTGDKIQMDVVEIEDPYGPTAWDADIHALVVSRETASGGGAINKLRQDKGLPQLEVFTIEVIGAQLSAAVSEGSGGATTQDLRGVVDESELKAVKMGSTGIRQWLAQQKRS